MSNTFRNFGSDVYLMKTQQELSNQTSIITTTEISTPLGPMLAGATEQGVCLLEFINRIRLEKEIIDLQKLLNAVMQPGQNPHLVQLENELAEYFEGKRKVFSVPLHTPGNEFAQTVWQTLQEIPYGQTCSYKQQADKMNNPKAIRAIASTNGRNRLAIIIPCHRVIGSDGSMTGYAAGVEKKKWLLKFERNNSEKPADTLF
ncbi:AraC family transcriptional regulator of adaptative response/methylated-DNA-[protein]-cysteine methyltransferase [Pedobacter cryoconitis]|uniref:Methylated-DNA--protein-cysteine methyltransferase n=2 Tax=Pedobacter cryoconitis TaxID=188932 RepID=A0A327SR78_9SPHI|nr:AraC family transcriptional regulator of adaptative response/methylated-DNA-[protein]-cysteine methyltransferase [Pedobacter cryoconitis]